MRTRHIMSAAHTSKPLRIAIYGVIVCCCKAAWAAGGAHEHGAAELLLSSEGRSVQLTFNAPAQSLVGFETAAVTAEQKAAVERAEAILMAASDLFVLEGKSCELIGAAVDVSTIIGVDNAQSQPREHAGYTDEHADHAEEHADHTDDHAGHTEDHADHDDEASDTDSHSDVSANYTFECDSDEALTRIAFKRGALPFGLERIDVLWAADWGQGTGKATPQSPQVNLRN